MTESQHLLAKYVETGSEVAVREIIDRYVHMVYSTALRCVGGDTHAAEDVVQTVFMHMSRNARKLSQGPFLGAWLHRDTCFVASKMIRSDRRRRARELQATLMTTLADHTEANLEEVATTLDQAINRLGNKDRSAILMRFFEQRDFRSIGAALGTDEDAARMRVHRALAKLHSILRREGVALSVSALGTALAANAVTAAPVGLAGTVLGSILSGAAAGGGLSAALLQIVTMTKLKTAWISAFVTVGLTTSLLIQRQTERQVREQDDSFRQRSLLLAQLQSENQRLSDLLGAPPNMHDALSRVRNEVQELQKQVRTAERENQQWQLSLRAAQQRPNRLVWQPDGLIEEAMKRTAYAKNLSMALLIYASDHHGQFPSNFDQVSDLIAARIGQETNFTTAQFEIVYSGSDSALTNYSVPDVLLIKEKQPWKTAGGQWAKVYAFADGHGVALSAVDDNFEAWEKQRIISPRR